MAVETLHPYRDGQVIREIVPGGYEERKHFLYPDPESALMAKKLESSRFVPKIIASLMDEGVRVPGSLLDEQDAAEPTFLHETIEEWQRQVPSSEVSHAA